MGEDERRREEEISMKKKALREDESMPWSRGGSNA
jgi:hypothetical protein